MASITARACPGATCRRLTEPQVLRGKIPLPGNPGERSRRCRFRRGDQGLLASGGFDPDFVERPCLLHANAPGLEQLEDADKGRDQKLARLAGGQIEKAQPPAAVQFLHKPVDCLLDRDLLFEDAMHEVRRYALHDLLVGLEEVEQRNRVKLGPFAVAAGGRTVPEDVAPREGLVPQPVGDLLELLVLEEPAHEIFPGIFLLLLPVRRCFARKQQLRLDLHQGRRHQHEFAGRFEVEEVDLSENAEVLVGDGGDGNVVDVDFVLADQEQQQVERALEYVELDSVLAAQRVSVLSLFDGRFQSADGWRLRWH